jgi:hypothetical protein
MDWPSFLEAIKTLGVPVAFATFLIWHFIHMNKTLQANNSRMLSEIERLRAQLENLVRQDSHGERLLQQNEQLAKIVESKDRDAQVLLKLLVEAQIGKNAVVTTPVAGVLQ